MNGSFCLQHRELCPACNRIALRVCEYLDPYPRVEAFCECCGYKAYDEPMELTKETLYKIVDKLSRKEIGAVCIDDQCASKDILKLLREGSYAEFRCLDCGAEWNSEEVRRALRRVKEVLKAVSDGSVPAELLKAQEGECPLCGWDIGHAHEGYLVEIKCPVCGYHNNYKEEFPKELPPDDGCPEFEKAEDTG